MREYLERYKDLTIKMIENDFTDEDKFFEYLNERESLLTKIESADRTNLDSDFIESVYRLDEKLLEILRQKKNDLSVDIDGVKEEMVIQGKSKKALQKYSVNSQYQESLYFDKTMK